jgi:DNA-directed RNA polymerase specialized sigma24 family protein
MSDPGSVTLWLNRLQLGDRSAIQEIWERFFRRLVGLARLKLGSMPRAAVDEEDVALSAFHSFFLAAEQGRFPPLSDRHDLWTVLLLITTRKARDYVQHEGRAKRDWHKVQQVAAAANGQNQLEEPVVTEVISREPDPALAAEMVERVRELLTRLGDEELRKIALRKLEGFTNDEIATEIDCAVATVERRLRLIRTRWWEERPA